MKRTNFTKIIKADGVSGAEILINSAKNKTHPFLYPTCEIKKNGYVIVDFGKELCGRLHMAFGCNCENASVRVRLGESVYETCAEIGEKNAGNYHSLRDNRYSVVSWGDISASESGFRFARIDNVGCEIIKLALIYAEESENGLTIKSDFSCIVGDKIVIDSNANFIFMCANDLQNAQRYDKKFREKLRIAKIPPKIRPFVDGTTMDSLKNALKLSEI